jgi:hypothetical protein
VRIRFSQIVTLSIELSAGLSVSVLTLFGSHAALAANHKARKPADTAYSGKSFNFQSLMALTTPQMTSMEQLIPLLPENYKKYFSLMFQSGSVQNASPLHPRVISYGSYGGLATDPDQAALDQLYLAFQTDPNGQYANTLEVIEWVPKSKNFDFYQIDFPITAASVTKNPQSCTVCHGTPLRPNWSSYPRWDGSFGNNNALSGKFNDPEATREQAQTLITQLKTASSKLKAFDFDAYFTQEIEYPNAYLSDKISSELKQRDVVQLRAWSDYSKLKYALAGAFLECKNFEQFFSPSLTAILKQGVIANLKNVPKTSEELTSTSNLNFDQLLKMTLPLIERDHHLSNLYINEVYITTWLRLIFEGSNQSEFLLNLLGNPMKTLPTDPAWTYDFVGFASRVTALRDQVLSDAASDFPDSMELYPNLVTASEDSSSITVDDGAQDSCNKLSSLSKKATARYVPKRKLTAILVAKPFATSGLFNNYCSNCHGSGPLALPLDDLDRLKAYRTKKGENISERLSRKEMPVQGAPQPSPAELKLMIDSLQ